MKTIKIFILLLLLPVLAFPQTNYYQDFATVKVNNEEYFVEYDNFTFSLRNSKNAQQERPRYKDGTPLPERVQPIAKMKNKEEIKNILREVFTPQEISKLKRPENNIMVGYVMDANGRVMDVSFSIPTKPQYYSLPPEKFYLLEKKIKERVFWEVDDRFKNVTHIPMTGFLFFDDL